ncbi:MAG: hypothetical protein D6795_08560 [Deltaproteobacteria bacterium]|nr:MAG: hypothetical protein D6795_08560 [Deltaproteobacteria bacterium]
MTMLGETLLFFAFGTLCWSFGEYALHNWVGHEGRGRNEFSREHLRHHSEPGYFSPTPTKVRAALPVLSLIALGTIVAFGPSGGVGFTLGFGLAYAGYEVLHRRLHTHPPRTRYGAFLRKHHFFHHFGNPSLNHGVSSPIWDIVFGTYRKPSRVIVPARHRFSWLCDPETGEVLPEYAAVYRLKPEGRRRPLPEEEAPGAQ